MKKYAKVNGCFLTDGNFNKLKVSKREVLSVAKRTTSRLGLDGFGMQYSITENEEFFSVMCHSGLNVNR